jgi:DNA polymerase III epsilon subunit-like protein
MDFSNWPRLVQLAFLCYDRDGKKTGSGNHIVKPDGFVIPSSATRIHGITTGRAVAEGEAIKKVLQEFQGVIRDATVFIAHNMNFDEKIIGSEFLRNGMQDILPSKQ